MKITVIGLGYVGTVAAASLASCGHDVLGVDIDTERISALQSGITPFYEPGLDETIRSAIDAGNLRIQHSDASVSQPGDIALITTGTPQAANGAADLHQVKSALEWVKSRRSKHTVVVMKSTVPPGTGQRIIEHDLRESGLCYASNPEFLREGQAVNDWKNPDRIVIGAVAGDTRSVAAIKAMHAGIEAPCIVTDITSAEMIKYASNAFLATRISFINEIATLCDRVGASIDAVSNGMALDPRTGGRIFAGVGYGGSCFPKDVRALDHLGLNSGANVELLRSVININNRQRLLPLYGLRERFGGNIAGLRVAVLGLAFKPNTDDVRDAPSLDLIRALIHDGAIVRAHDPEAMATARSRLPTSVRLTENVLEAADQAQALVLMTEWSQFVSADWRDIARCMRPPRFIFDGRNALDANEIRLMGFEYVGVGRSGLANGSSAQISPV